MLRVVLQKERGTPRRYQAALVIEMKLHSSKSEYQQSTPYYKYVCTYIRIRIRMNIGIVNEPKQNG